MAREAYQDFNFRRDTLAVIEQLQDIVTEYQAQGYVLTVRQLYYQMVARGYVENTLQSYKRVASICNDARLGGLLDWDAIEDRTRDFVRQTRWDDGPHILRACINSYHQDMWVNQSSRVFVIVEKEALVGVLDRVCRQYDVPLLAARGYPSGTVLREFALEDLVPALEAEQVPVILHLGDHDPSGLDMTRDLTERIEMFSYREVELHRIALNMAQVQELNPPENPAKATDARFATYQREFGDSSWELDALPPDYLNNLVGSEIRSYIDDEAWQETAEKVNAVKVKLEQLAKEWR